MKKLILLLLLSLGLACSSDNDTLVNQISVSLRFTHNWDGEVVTIDDFNVLDFTNKKGTKLSIERLRYLISRVELINAANDTLSFDGYKLVDLAAAEDVLFDLPNTILEGPYRLECTFGFNNEDNIDSAYPDLNSANWNVPENLGGGYHFMQLDGKFKDSLFNESPYNFHAIQAYDMATQETKDTFFRINFGTISISKNATIELKMNIAQWFKDPHEWDLNERSTQLMMNFEAQKQISDNGRNVFSLGTVSQ